MGDSKCSLIPVPPRSNGKTSMECDDKEERTDRGVRSSGRRPALRRPDLETQEYTGVENPNVIENILELRDETSKTTVVSPERSMVDPHLWSQEKNLHGD